MPPAVAQPRSQHPPLAHDGRGFPIAVPDGAAAWRVKRQTAGRPKVVLGPDRQPLRLPLDSTTSDLLDLCGAGTFRLDAIDDTGQAIDFVATVTVGNECAADPLEVDPLPNVVGPRAGSGSDLRYALEVTAHMARAQSEALRSIANAQADWIKGLASAKVLPRNALWHAPPPPVANDVEADEDDDDDDELAPDPGMTMLGHIASIARDVSPLVKAILPSKEQPVAEVRNAAVLEPAAATTSMVDVATPSIRIATVLAQASPRARAVACRLLARNNETAREVANALQTLPIAEAVAQLEALARDLDERGAARSGETRRAVDPAAHMAAVMTKLSPDEIGRAQALLRSLDAAQVEQLKADLLAMSPDDAAAFVRRALAQRGGAPEGSNVGA